MLKIGDVIKTEEFGDFIAEYTVTDVDCRTVNDIPCTFKIEMICKPKRKPYNGEIFVARYPTGFELFENTLYTVKNGEIISTNTFRTTSKPYIFDDMDDTQLSEAIAEYEHLICRPSAYFVKRDKSYLTRK